MKTWTTLTTFVNFLIVIGLAGATSAHAGGSFMVDTDAARLKTCVELDFENCPRTQITALGPLGYEPGVQSAVAEQSLKTLGNRDAVVESHNFPPIRQTLTKIFNSHINELFEGVILPEPAFSSGESSFLANGIEYFGPKHTLEAAEPLGLHNPLLFQFGADIGIDKSFGGGK